MKTPAAVDARCPFPFLFSLMLTGTHYRACNLCEAICGLEIRVEEGRITSIRGDRDDPLSRGHICPKAVALQDLQSDPDRLRHPLLRTPSGWREIPWPEAFDRAADGLRQVQREHGRQAVAVYLGNPTVHNYGSLLFGPRFVRALGTRNRFSATSVDQLPHHLAASLMLGNPLLLPVPDIDRTHFFLALGANPAASNGSMMTAPGMKERLKEVRRRGGTLVVVDPRRTETARLADRHLFIRPGSDVFLLAALLETIFREDLATPGRLERLFRPGSLAELRELTAPFPAGRAERATGIPAREIRRLARELATAPSAVCYGRVGLSTQEHGGLCQWLLVALNAVTGNLDRTGGALFPHPAVDVAGRLAGRRCFDRWRSRVRELPELLGELPVATLAEEITTPGEGQIRALVTSAGNPVLSTPDGNRLDRALAGLDFLLSIDLYLNETTRHAHLILPPTPPLEHDHYDLAFHLLAVRNTARYSPALFPPPPGTRHDWQIFLELERRLAAPRGAAGRLAAALSRTALARLGPAGLLDLALRRGPYGAGFRPFARGLRLAVLKRAPHGVDLGPLEPCLPRGLATSDRRIDLAPELFADGLHHLDQRLAADGERSPVETGTLLLVGRRQVRSNNSWMHNAPRLVKGKDRCTLQVHPHDAARLDLEEGGRARVTSRVGSVEAPVEVTDEMMAGVVSLPHGWGHGRPGVRLATAAAHPGVSANDLTDADRVDRLTGNAVLNGVPVRVERA